MQYLIYIAYGFYIAAAVFMVGAILLQEGKGGGLSALGGTQAESAFGASNPVRRMTVVLAIFFFILAGFLSYMSPRSSVTVGGTPATTEPGGPAEKKKPGAGEAAPKDADAKGTEAPGGETDAAPAGAGDKDAAKKGEGAAAGDAPAPAPVPAPPKNE